MEMSIIECISAIFYCVNSGIHIAHVVKVGLYQISFTIPFN